MRNRIHASSISVAFVLALVAACSSTPGGSSDDTSPGVDAGTARSSDDSGNTNNGDESSDAPSGPKTNGAWTLITPLPDAKADLSVISGIWFDSTTNGAVAFQGGAIEHFSSPTQADAIALDGMGDTYLGFIPTSVGLVAVNGKGKSTLVTSADKGKTFTYGNLYGATTMPAAVKGQIQLGGLSVGLPLVMLASDANGTWFAADRQDGFWTSPTAPSKTANFTLDWHPQGDIPVPNPVPAADCDAPPGNGYFSDLPGQVVASTTDGKALLYGTGGADGSTPMLCRSTDGGKNFVPVKLPALSESYYPWLISFTSPTDGIAAFGSDGEGSAYVYTTSDAGATWTAGALPPGSSGEAAIALTYVFASPSGTLFMTGATGALSPNGAGLLLYKSKDKGHTWTDVSAKLASFANETNGPTRARVGFALDDQNIWIGADEGFIAHSSTGGE